MPPQQRAIQRAQPQVLRDLPRDQRADRDLDAGRASSAFAIVVVRASIERLRTAPAAEVKKSRLRLPASGVPLIPESSTSADDPSSARS